MDYGDIIENEEKSHNTREAVRLNKEKSVSWLGIEPRTIVYAPLRSDSWAIQTQALTTSNPKMITLTQADSK